MELPHKYASMNFGKRIRTVVFGNFSDSGGAMWVWLMDHSMLDYYIQYKYDRI